MANTIKIINALFDLERDLKNESVVACGVDVSSSDIKTSEIEGIGLGNSEKQYYIPFSGGLTLSEIQSTLQRIFKDKVIIFHNAKHDFQMLKKYGIEWPKKIHDIMIMSWLADENASHSLKSLAMSILGRKALSRNDLNRNLNLFRSEKEIAHESAEYCAGDVRNTFGLYKHFLPTLKKEGLLLDYEEIELKLIPVLAKMELRGVKVNLSWLKQKKVELEKVLEELETQMAKKIGDTKVNVRSPKQLENFLFNVLKYPVVKLTPAGKNSTDDYVLADLVKKLNLKEKDFIPLLLKFRELDKLYRTYILALIKQADKDGIVNTVFLQHGTRTGRVASSNPNLQAIPLRNDGWNVRKAFIPREGYKFLVSDYNQVELRMLAHLSQDKEMVAVFNNNGDIHTKTMELTKTNRKDAKSLNFGLVYGMGSRSLAYQLGVKEDQAEEYIKKFFAGYPTLRSYIARVQQKALGLGYVGTLAGRRRRFYKTRDGRWRNAIRRQAINSAIQGSAADLIKIAMIKLDKVLEPFDAHQLIQIHDEIVIEVSEKNLLRVERVVKETMENVLKLRVPLKVEVGEGDYWIKD